MSRRGPSWVRRAEAVAALALVALVAHLVDPVHSHQGSRCIHRDDKWRFGPGPDRVPDFGAGGACRFRSTSPTEAEGDVGDQCDLQSHVSGQGREKHY